MKAFSRFSVVSSVLFLLITSLAARSEEVWFAPPDNMDRGPRTYNHDFPALFDAAPRWSMRADAFKLSPKFVAQAPEEEIRRVTDFLTSHHISIIADTGAVQMDSPTPVPGECGFGVEGYARPGRNQIVFNRWKRLGREVQYVSFDEPLSFGHHYHGKNACKFSIQEVAKRTAATVAEIRKFYPNAKIVDAEAVATTEPGTQWLSDLQQWLTAYHQAVGEYPYAVIFDIQWNLPWLPTVRAATDLLHRKGVRAGYFLDGAGSTDAAAVADLKKNMSAMDAAKVPLVVGLAEELNRINTFLKGRHIALAEGVDATLMDNPNRTPGECGFGIEGSNRPGRYAGEFKRLKPPARIRPGHADLGSCVVSNTP